LTPTLIDGMTAQVAVAWTAIAAPAAGTKLHSVKVSERPWLRTVAPILTSTAPMGRMKSTFRETVATLRKSPKIEFLAPGKTYLAQLYQDAPGADYRTRAGNPRGRHQPGRPVRS
jgi:hypothetical protein